MRHVLHGLRTRVDRLVAAVAFSTCDGQHTVTHVSRVLSGDPVPDWPPAEAATHCRCGAALDYHHIIFVRDEPVP